MWLVTEHISKRQLIRLHILYILKDVISHAQFTWRMVYRLRGAREALMRMRFSFALCYSYAPDSPPLCINIVQKRCSIQHFHPKI